MKTLITTAALFFALIAQAGQENFGVGIGQYKPEAIYKALKVKAVNLNPGLAGSSLYQKSVGGLSCTRTLIIVPGAKPTYECAIDTTKENFEAIYKALKVKEEALNPGIVSVGRFQKSVGGLVCLRELIVVPNAKPTFECQIQE